MSLEDLTMSYNTDKKRDMQGKPRITLRASQDGIRMEWNWKFRQSLVLIFTCHDTREECSQVFSAFTKGTTPSSIMDSNPEPSEPSTLTLSNYKTTVSTIHVTPWCDVYTCTTCPPARRGTHDTRVPLQRDLTTQTDVSTLSCFNPIHHPSTTLKSTWHC
ncbi:hypothetical protein Bbelb_239800 [Branchiostoma belcheri]|nr:hypothetical protein Bbelb_239800 [Branchiostoma belcheri]